MDWPKISGKYQNLISFYSEELDFQLADQHLFEDWLQQIAKSEGHEIESLSYIFCTDDFLLKKNQEYLDHNTLTDIITFQYSDSPLSGDVFISIERVEENAKKYDVDFMHELKRVMAHGVLHLCGYKDKTDEEKKVMRKKEDHYIQQVY